MKHGTEHGTWNRTVHTQYNNAQGIIHGARGKELGLEHEM